MKRFLKILLCIICVFSFAVSFVVILQKEEEKEKGFEKLEKISYTEYLPIENYIKPIGRTYYENNVRYLSFSGSGIEFKAKGERISFEIFGIFHQYQSLNQKARFLVLFGDNVVLDELVDYDSKVYDLNISHYAEGVDVKIIKVSEAQYSSMAVGKIGVLGEYKIMPAEKKGFNFEFIGDSITCGYGLDETDGSENFKTQTENFLKTYSYLTAKNFDADVSAISFSGYGVYSGFSVAGRNSDDVVARYYDRGSLVQKEHIYDFSDEMDLVVINLGTNDASYFSRNRHKRSLFTDEYMSLIKLVREKNPSAYILCILGDMNNMMYREMEKAVELYISETYDMRISVHSISFDMANTDVTIQGHPGCLANIHASNSLNEIINNLIFEGKIAREE